MPELPEVETVKRYLASKIIKDKIIKIELKNKKSLKNVKESDLLKIKGQLIINIDRFAKNLIFNLKKNYLIIHLRMEGKFFVFDTRDEAMKKTNRFYDVLIMETNKHTIIFQDTRRFATIDLFKNEVSLKDNPILNKLSNEPWNMNGDKLFSKLKNKTIAIKSALLDQSIISGIGNIYADEVLYACKIHPQRKSKNVSINECNLIIKKIISIFNKSISLNGTTIKNYTSSLGVEGKYQNKLKVHQKEGSICKRDNNKILKIKVGGRGTYYCPLCQK